MDLALVFSAVLLLSLACQWLAWRVQQPAILLLLLAGIVIGPVLDWMHPDALLGELLFPFVSLSVAIILFEGALTLRREEMGDNARVIRRLVSSGILINWVVVSLAAYWLLDLREPIAAVLGAVSVVTGPTVIAPMLRTVRPSRPVAAILRWESILIDPVGALLAVMVYEYVLASLSGGGLGQTLLVFSQTVLMGLSLGFLGGYGTGVVLRKMWLPDYLRNFSVLAMVLAMYAVSNHWFHDSGLLAVVVMGLVMANMDGVDTSSVLEFKETLSVVLISMLFILLAARLEPRALLGLNSMALVFLAVVLWVARPLGVWFSTRKSRLRWQEKVMLSWMAPRGIVAAAVSSLFALKMDQLGIEGAQRLVPLVFLTIIGSVLIQSLTSRPLAKWLGVAAPPATGFLLLGANPFARALAQALMRQGVRVLLVDTSWEEAQSARMAGMEVYYGNPLSEHAEQALDLTGIAHFLAVSPYRQMNTLAGYHYITIFGENNSFMLYEPVESRRSDSGQLWARLPNLFDGASSYGRLAKMMQAGASVKETGLTEVFSWDEYCARQETGSLPLFAVDPKGRVHLFSEKARFQPEAGWRVISLVQPEARGAQESSLPESSPPSRPNC
ncbi:MAG: sodium:proton antiporter [Rhodocyclaceae bacterium]|nr:sodium:proton antiporter [Rhodocyclaceae bacterium]